ncbi:hypothetical protein [Vannielia litorea]|uniref:hypothetical protein n=1 Tax=Vannielia litorea TaxID=1217970 RepID=UPI001C954D41|nr:hypothetical protein [Vannielia litorea]MBY6073979.1 hypothetical protein [Vannielia litorea]
MRCFYQLANRLAFLSFLRQRGIDALLLLVGFVGDEERNGPTSAEAWQAAEATAFYALGLPASHALRRAVVSIHPRVQDLS